MKNTLLLYFRMALLMCINLYTSRIVLHALGVEDYGIYNVVGGIVIMFGFLNDSMTVSTQRFMSFELGAGNKERLNQVFVTSLNIHFIISLIIVALAETVGLWFVMEKMVIPPERMRAALWCYHISIFTAVIDMLSYPYISAIVAHERMKSFAYIAILDAVLKLLLVYLLLAFSFDRLIFYAVLYAAEKILIRMVYNTYCLRHFDECHYHWLINKSMFREMAVFAAWNMWGNLAYVCYTQGLNMMLNVFFGPVVNAARGVAVQVQGTIGNFANNFQMAMNPQITKTYASRQLTETHQLIYKGSRLTFCLMLILCLPILAETTFILNLWLKEVPDGAVLFLRLLLLIILVQKFSSPLATAVASTGRIKKYETLVNGLMLTILPLAYLTLQLGAPPYAVFIIYLIVVILAYALTLNISLPIIRLPLRQYIEHTIVPCARVIFFSIIPPIAFKLLLPHTPMLAMLDIALTLAVAITASFFCAIDPQERQLIKNKLHNII